MIAKLLPVLISTCLLLLSAIGLFLSLWIIIPAPTFTLLPLGVGAPEVSPWLFVLNAIAVLLILFSHHKGWIYSLAIAGSVMGLVLSAYPLSQVAAANQKASSAMYQTLGIDYVSKIPVELQAQLRPQPFVLADVFRGIPTGEVRQQSGIQFAQPDGVPLFLEVYQPPLLGTQPGRHPTLVTIYGGAWQTGNPAVNGEFNRYMAARGYTVIAIDYRHAPKYPFPAQIADVRSALNYIREHAEALEVNLERMVLMGRSAGAQLAMLAAYAPNAPRLRAVVNYYGPVNLTLGYNQPPDPDPINSRAILQAFLGGTPQQKPDLYRAASPYTYATGKQPPTLLIYGGREHVVQAKFGRALSDRLKAAGNQTVFIELPWSEHAFDSIFNGVGNQLALYYTERFVAWAMQAGR
ncbi:MAG TPA: alpha/beta hydrolase [Coleofasciculaceae cyanobacterium]